MALITTTTNNKAESEKNNLDISLWSRMISGAKEAPNSSSSPSTAAAKLSFSVDSLLASKTEAAKCLTSLICTNAAMAAHHQSELAKDDADDEDEEYEDEEDIDVDDEGTSPSKLAVPTPIMATSQPGPNPLLANMAAAMAAMRASAAAAAAVASAGGSGPTIPMPPVSMHQQSSSSPPVSTAASVAGLFHPGTGPPMSHGFPFGVPRFPLMGKSGLGKKNSKYLFSR